MSDRSAPPLKALADLLIAVFNEQELRRLFLFWPADSSLSAELGASATLVELAHETVALLRRKGLILQFLDLVESERPLHKEAVDRVRAGLGPERTIQPAPAPAPARVARGKPKTARRPAVPPPSGPVAQIVDAAQRGKLVAIVGTGFSLAVSERKLPALGWQNLIKNGLETCLRLGKITAKQRDRSLEQVDSDDLDDLLLAAEFVGRKLDAPHGDLYARWFKDAVGPAVASHAPTIAAFRRLADADVPICTLNYDHLLEQVTSLPTITLADRHRVAEFMRREHRGILHLHGSYERPETCVLGVRDYAATVGDDIRDLLQRSLAAFDHLLFIGCGATFSDPNFRALVPWLRKHLGAIIPRHYTLVRQPDAARIAADPACHGFVEPLAYGDDHADLPAFLERLFPAKRRTARADPPASAARSSAAEDLLRTYRKFLLRECGEMTIEGMRADADTASRRFDLERLFVPMRLTEVEPHRQGDPDASARPPPPPRPFASVFRKHRRLAILALPGGGKTVLLKRLAVAYADPDRRGKSSDDLPELDLVPVLIRCRDWRDHIDRPILALFDGIAAHTGRQELQGLGEALRPRLKQGSVLLLVDGLDEIHDDTRRSAFVRNLRDFLSEFERVRVVVTSREAGFDLVASDVATICQSSRIAPLDAAAIDLLASHWHTLLLDDSPQTRLEARGVVETILQSDALRRLAENPLLLTMLLVVKHGRGRLPPDRVTLYERAVDVLLNTWNIPGHAPLDSHETIPSLAYVAYQMLARGKTTVTRSELLQLLEAARDDVPKIGRYARGTPLEFLRSVELRSSLLLEGGTQTENDRPVPFYQFRHLTFQEYLAAVAVHDGYYPRAAPTDDILVPLEPHLLADEWKEVLPMAAVLAKRKAQPLLTALVARAAEIQARAKRGESSLGEWLSIPRVLPAPVARLMQCLVEQTEVEPPTLDDVLRTIAFFASGGVELSGFDVLCRGPYGEDFFRFALDMAPTRDWPIVANLHFTCARIALERAGRVHWTSPAGLTELTAMLRHPDPAIVTRGLYLTAGLLWGSGLPASSREEIESVRPSLPRDLVEQRLLDDAPHLRLPAIFAWRLLHPRFDSANTSTYTRPACLDKLLRIWLDDDHVGIAYESSVSLMLRVGHPRNHWTPVLRREDIESIHRRAAIAAVDPASSLLRSAALMVAFHAQLVPNEVLAPQIAAALGTNPSYRKGAIAALRQLGPLGQRLALSLAEPSKHHA